MKLFKIIIFFFIIYFIRRFIQLYKTMKELQNDASMKGQNNKKEAPATNIINADFKVID